MKRIDHEDDGNVANKYVLRQGGPSPRARLPLEIKITQGHDAYMLHIGEHLSFRAIGRRLGVSKATAWRRWHWYNDSEVYPTRARSGRPAAGHAGSTAGCPWSQPSDATPSRGRPVPRPPS